MTTNEAPSSDSENNALGADARLQKLYDFRDLGYELDDESEDAVKLHILAQALNLSGGIARTCEDRPESERLRYDRIAAETVFRSMWGRG